MRLSNADFASLFVVSSFTGPLNGLSLELPSWAHGFAHSDGQLMVAFSTNHGVVRSIMFYYVAFLSILSFLLGFTNLLFCVSLPFGYGLKATTLCWFVIINPL
jgi:membrane-associated protease RseP (regulator of RpoE activity)